MNSIQFGWSVQPQEIKATTADPNQDEDTLDHTKPSENEESNKAEDEKERKERTGISNNMSNKYKHAINEKWRKIS